MTQGFAREARLGVDLHVGETLYYTANDTFVKADYPGLYGVRVKVQGAGGGSGGCASGSNEAVGGGGGGGGYTEKVIQAADLGTSETVTVAAGGAGGSAGANNGSTAGSTSFGSHCSATGGGGGGGMSHTSGTGGSFGGGPGIGSDGDINLNGGGGHGGRVISGSGTFSGHGGGAQLAAPRFGRTTAGNGDAGLKYGGGARGAYSTAFNQAGGAGADGIVIVEVLYERKIAVDEDIHTQYLNDTRHTTTHAYLRARRNTSNQTLTDNSPTVIIYNDIVDEDDPDNHLSINTSTGVVTINTTGVYSVSAGLLGNNDVWEKVFFRIRKNGTDMADMQTEISTSATVVANVSTTFKAAATDTIDAQCILKNNDGTDNFIASSTASYIAVTRIA